MPCPVTKQNIYLMDINEYRKLENKECLLVLSRKGLLMDEVVVQGMLRLRLYSLANYYVQAVFNKHDNTLLEVKPLTSDDDWEPYLESKNLKNYF